MASKRGLSNGPDWIDVAMVMSALETFHNVEISVTLSLVTGADTGTLKIVAKATKRKLATADQRNSVSRSLTIGSSALATVNASTFRLLYELDRDCGAMWNQAEMNVSV